MNIITWVFHISTRPVIDFLDVRELFDSRIQVCPVRTNFHQRYFTFIDRIIKGIF